MAERDPLEDELRRLEKRGLQRIQQSRSGPDPQDRADAAAMEAEAERAGAHEIAEAILDSKGLRPTSTGLVVTFLLAFAMAAGGVPPLWVAIGTIVALLIELTRLGSGELVNPGNLFYILFVVFHIFIDAVQAFSYGPSRFTALFAFGLVYWGLFRRNDVPFNTLNAGRYAGLLLGCIFMWVVYGFVPTIFSWLARVGVGQEVFNVLLVVGPPIVLLFLLPETLLIKSGKQFWLILGIIALVAFAYNAGLAGSVLSIPGLQASPFAVDRWGAASNFGMLFWNPIKHATLNFYEMVYAPACHTVIDGLEKFVGGESSGMADSLCPAIKELEAKKRFDANASSTPGGLAGWISHRIDFATGQVEETKKEPPGVFLDPLIAQSAAVEGQPVIATSQIRAVTLDKPLNINLFCKAMGEKSNHTADSITPAKTIVVEKKDQKGIICMFDSLPAETFTFLVTASFDFKTVSYTKSYLALDTEISALGSRDAWFDRYDITERSPEPKFTPGPVSMGVRIEEQQPIIMYPKASPQRLFINIPIQNAYNGKVRQINRLLIALPKGLELEGVFGGRQKGDIEKIECNQLSDEDRRGCNDDFFNVYDVVVQDKDVTGITYRAVATVADYVSLLSPAPPAAQYVKVIVDYNYVLEQRSPGLTIEKAASKGLTEEVESR